MLRPGGEVEGLRAGLLLLVVLGGAGTALALAYDRHWQTPWQLVPWITLGAVSVAWAALVMRQTAATAWLARAVAVLAIVVATLGVWRHVDANYNADPAVDHHAATSPGSADAEEERSRGGHHHDGEDAAGDGHHHADDETPASAAAGSEAPATTSRDVNLVDAMTGSAGHAPVPSALAIVPVGLALALATIGLGGPRGPSGG